MSIAAVQAENQELAELYQSVFMDYTVFPPLTPDPNTFKLNASAIRPIEVVIGTAIDSIDDINPADAEFTITARTLIYYRKSECNQTEVHMAACNPPNQNPNRLKFVGSLQTKDITPYDGFLIPNAHEQAFIDQGKEEEIPDLQYASFRATLKHIYDMRLYPFEFHELKFSAVSAYSNNVVSLTAANIIMEKMGKEPSVPPSWTFRGVSCDVTQSDKPGFDSYECTIKVSRTNPSWWLTSFFLAAGLCSLAVVGNAGVMSHHISEARDDKDRVREAAYDGTRQMGTFTVALLLTYVFKVEISPYGKPIEYWPSVPASTMIYVLGMAYILFQSMCGHIASFVFPVQLARQGFEGRASAAYNLDKLPVEGKDGADESLHALLKHTYGRESAKDDVKEELEESAGAVQIKSIRLNRDKTYHVLSAEEAAMVNKHVKQLFALKLSLIVVVIIGACIILGNAGVQYQNLIEDSK